MNVYLRWDMDANSWNAHRRLLSVHQTLEGAIAAVPENIRTGFPDREPSGSYVKDYAYEAIEEVKLEP